jgi:hypothetical protein
MLSQHTIINFIYNNQKPAGFFLFLVSLLQYSSKNRTHYCLSAYRLDSLFLSMALLLRFCVKYDTVASVINRVFRMTSECPSSPLHRRPKLTYSTFYYLLKYKASCLIHFFMTCQTTGINLIVMGLLEYFSTFL